MKTTKSKTARKPVRAKFTVKYQCSDCGKFFKTKEELYEHQFTDAVCWKSHRAEVWNNT